MPDAKRRIDHAKPEYAPAVFGPNLTIICIDHEEARVERVPALIAGLPDGLGFAKVGYINHTPPEPKPSARPAFATVPVSPLPVRLSLLPLPPNTSQSAAASIRGPRDMSSRDPQPSADLPPSDGIVHVTSEEE